MLFLFSSPLAKTDRVCFSFDPIDVTVKDYSHPEPSHFPGDVTHAMRKICNRGQIFEECADTAGEVGEDHTETTDSPEQQLGPGDG